MATKQKTEKESFTRSGKTIYLTNKELLHAVVEAKKVGVMTDTLARMLQLMCSKYIKKGRFVNYSYAEDMQSYAMMMLVRTWQGFHPEKSSNPFAFYTQCIKNSFFQYLNMERKHRDIRNLLLIDNGLNPSFGFQDGHTQATIEDEQDFESAVQMAEMLKNLEVDTPIERDEAGMEITTPSGDYDDEDNSGVYVEESTQD